MTLLLKAYCVTGRCLGHIYSLHGLACAQKVKANWQKLMRDNTSEIGHVTANQQSLCTRPTQHVPWSGEIGAALCGHVPADDVIAYPEPPVCQKLLWHLL